MILGISPGVGFAFFDQIKLNLFLDVADNPRILRLGRIEEKLNIHSANFGRPD
jgi:hypothetical protein